MPITKLNESKINILLIVECPMIPPNLLGKFKVDLDEVWIYLKF